MLRSLGVALLLPFVPATAFAQDARDVSTTDGEEIVVLGREGRRSDRVASSDLATQRMSQSSRSIERDMLDAYGTRRLGDALELVSGISQQNNLGGLRDNFAVRGFLGTPDTGAEYYVDGFLANRGFGPPRDPANVERIEVLKGPGGALFGEIDPGGRVNLVTKTPRFETATSAALTVGSFGTVRGEIDVTGPLSATIAARIVVAAENGDGFRDTVDLRRRLVAPSIRWTPAPGTTLTYAAEFLQVATPFDRGIPAVAGDTDAIPRTRFFGEPADGRVLSRNVRHQLTGEQSLGDGWALNGGIAWRKAALNGFSSEQSRLVGDRTLWRQRRYRDFDVDDLSGRIELAGRIGAHRPSFGVRYYHLDFTERQVRRSPSAALPYAIDLYAPVYGGTTAALLPFTDQRETRDSVTLYAQDLWEVTDRLSLVGGVRLDQLDQRLDNRRTGSRADTKRSPLDFRVGARFKLDDHLALHANYGESFRANSSTGRTGEGFAPERGHGYELGVRGAWSGVDLAATWFDIAKSNILTTDPADANFLATVGEVRSRGIEVDASARLGGGWQLVGNYAWTHARADDPAFPGSDVLNVPEHSGTLLAVGRFPDRRGAGLEVSAGATYVGNRAAALDGGNVRLPSFVKAKAAVGYAVTPHWSVRAELDNLFDATYAQSSYSALWIMPGAPRTLLFTLRYTGGS